MNRKLFKKHIAIIMSLCLVAQGAPVMQADVFLTPPGESELCKSLLLTGLNSDTTVHTPPGLDAMLAQKPDILGGVSAEDSNLSGIPSPYFGDVRSNENRLSHNLWMRWMDELSESDANQAGQIARRVQQIASRAHWMLSPGTAFLSGVRSVARQTKKREIPPNIYRNFKAQKTLGDQIKILLHWKKLTHQAFEELYGLVQSQLNLIVNNKLQTKPRKSTIELFSRVFGIDEGEFLVDIKKKEHVIITDEMQKEVEKLDTLGKRIKKLMGYTGLTYEKIEKDYGISKTCLVEMVHDRVATRPFDSTLKKLARAFGVKKEIFIVQIIPDIPQEVRDSIMAEKTTAKRIKRLLAYCRLFPKDLSKMVGVRKNRISNIDRYNVDFELVAKIAGIFNVDVVKLLMGKKVEEYKTQYNLRASLITLMLDSAKKKIDINGVWTALMTYIGDAGVSYKDIEMIISESFYLCFHEKLQGKKIRSLRKQFTFKDNIPFKELDAVMSGKTMGNRIRKLREYFHLYQSELGRIIGIEHYAVSRLERNEIQKPRFDQIAHIARIFKVDLLRFLIGDDAGQCKTEYDRNVKLIGVVLDWAKKPMTLKQIEREINGTKIEKITISDVQLAVSFNRHLYAHKNFYDTGKEKEPDTEVSAVANHLRAAKDYFDKGLYIWAEHEYRCAEKSAGYSELQVNEAVDHSKNIILRQIRKGISNCIFVLRDSICNAKLLGEQGKKVFFINLLEQKMRPLRTSVVDRKLVLTPEIKTSIEKELKSFIKEKIDIMMSSYNRLERTLWECFRDEIQKPMDEYIEKFMQELNKISSNNALQNGNHSGQSQIGQVLFESDDNQTGRKVLERKFIDPIRKAQ